MKTLAGKIYLQFVDRLLLNGLWVHLWCGGVYAINDVGEPPHLVSSLERHQAVHDWSINESDRMNYF